MPPNDDALKETLLGLFTECAIIEHLVRNRAERYYADGMSTAAFGIVNYFIRNHNGPDTIAGIAFSFQEDQAYTSEKVAALEADAMVTVDPPGSRAPDAVVTLTQKARDLQQRKLEEMHPDFSDLVAEIPFDALKATHATLLELRLTLDNLPDR